jgi:hypothetical protein
MPAERVSMRRVREILRLKFECGSSDRAPGEIQARGQAVAMDLLSGKDMLADRGHDRIEQPGCLSHPIAQRRTTEFESLTGKSRSDDRAADGRNISPPADAPAWPVWHACAGSASLAPEPS